MRKLLFVLIGFFLFTLVGCTKKTAGDENIAENYVKSLGYKVIAHNGFNKYTLDKSKLYGQGTMQYQSTWRVQKSEPEKYFGKEITVVEFIVKNHPLQKVNKLAKNSVCIGVMLSEEKVIGGFSYFNADDNGGKLPSGTGVMAIDGRSLEEVTGLSYEKWQDNWEKKYGN